MNIDTKINKLKSHIKAIVKYYKDHKHDQYSARIKQYLKFNLHHMYNINKINDKV